MGLKPINKWAQNSLAKFLRSENNTLFPSFWVCWYKSFLRWQLHCFSPQDHRTVRTFPTSVFRILSFQSFSFSWKAVIFLVNAVSPLPWKEALSVFIYLLLRSTLLTGTSDLWPLISAKARKFGTLVFFAKEKHMTHCLNSTTF